METERTSPDLGWMRFIATVLLPLSAGYFLSYFFRNVNGPIAADLVRETGADAALLGLLTAMFFVAVVPSQLPLGVALDRYGPRRVQAPMLAIAAAGTALFAASHSVGGLAAGRFLIGMGMAACLNSGLTATMLWAGRTRHLPLLNGVFVMFGGLGALAATVPLAASVDAFGWRAVFGWLAAATGALSVITWMLVPDPAVLRSTVRATLRGHPANRFLWTFAPMSALAFGTVSALIGLWAARWFADVEGLGRAAIAHRLLLMAVALTAGAPLLGLLTARLGAVVRPGTIAACVATLAAALEAAICLNAPGPAMALWGPLALLGAIPVLGYAVLAEFYPPELIGRANAVLNMAHTAGIFAVQYAIGLVVSLWPPASGVYPAAAYKTAVLGVALVQMLTVLIYLAHRIAAALVARTGSASRPLAEAPGGSGKRGPSDGTLRPAPARRSPSATSLRRLPRHSIERT